MSRCLPPGAQGAAVGISPALLQALYLRRADVATLARAQARPLKHSPERCQPTNAPFMDSTQDGHSH